MIVPQKKILLLRLSSYGDILLTTPAISFLHTYLPQARIDYLTYAHFSDMIEFHPDLGTVFAFPKKKLIHLLRHLRLFQAYKVWKQFIRDLQEKKYDAIIDLHSVTDSAILSLKARGKTRICNSSQALGIFFTKRIKLTLKNEASQIHASNLALLTVKASGILPQNCTIPLIPKLKLTFPNSALEYAASRLRALHLDNAIIVGINPTSSRSFKCWDPEKFSALANLIHQGFGFSILLMGEDDAALEPIAHAMAVNPSRISGLPPLFAFSLITECDFFISNDSGPMHIAAASGVPQLAIFGHSNLVKFMPLSDKAIILQTPLACTPCSEKNASLCLPRTCLASISVQQAWLEFRHLAELQGYTPKFCTCETD